MIRNKTIFICPLDWGMGHSSRCVSIINELKEHNKILLGVTELNLDFFEIYFPELEKISVPSYNISYSEKLPLWLKLVSQWSSIKKVIQKENLALQSIIEEHKIDLVISDNRFGLYSDKIKSIFITHQLNIQAPFFSGLINKINRKYIHKFTEIWVPDFEDKNLRLSGILSDSEGIQIPVKYIGPKSALSLSTQKTVHRKIDYLILLSGVEPQRTILEKKLLSIFSSKMGEVVLVRGTKNTKLKTDQIAQIIDFASGDELKELIVNAETVICRSGYSSLMDLYLLNKKKIILIPTPGQTEQEYLADVWKKKFGAVVYAQKDLNTEFKIH